MPPTARHEHGVAGVLHELVDLDRVAVLASYPRQKVYEVVDLRQPPMDIEGRKLLIAYGMTDINLCRKNPEQRDSNSTPNTTVGICCVVRTTAVWNEHSLASQNQQRTFDAESQTAFSKF